MDSVNVFLTDYATPHRRDLLVDTYDKLVSLGHVDHEINIENFVSLQGSIDTTTIISLIENELLEACHTLALKYYIVCRKEDKLRPYLLLLEVLDYLENTIESTTLIYHNNDELEPIEQFLSWVDVFRNDLSTDISDLILDVMPSLIDNILETHELKVDVEPIEHDEPFHQKIGRLKILRGISSHELLAVKLIKRNEIKNLMSLDLLNRKFNKSVYALDVDPTTTALNVISLAIMSKNDIGSLGHDSKSLTNLLYDDVKKTMSITDNIDRILNQAGDLCKTMNTI